MPLNRLASRHYIAHKCLWGAYLSVSCYTEEYHGIQSSLDICSSSTYMIEALVACESPKVSFCPYFAVALG